MDTATIRAAISADPALRALVPDTVALAAALSRGRTKLAPRYVGIGTVLSVLGLGVGNAFLDFVQATPAFRHVWPLLVSAHLSVDDPLVGTSLRSLVGVTLAPGIVFEAAHVEALLAIARVPDPVDEYSVRVALFADDGKLLV